MLSLFIRVFWKLRREGLIATYRDARGRLVLSLFKHMLQKLRHDGSARIYRDAKGCLRLDTIPFSRADRTLLFATDLSKVQDPVKGDIRENSMIVFGSQGEATYPEIYQLNDRFLRYAYLPAVKESRGLIVLFHGHNAYLHMGPMVALDYFDVLAPWDTFGARRQGSWFWGERGDNFVELLIQGLIQEYRGKRPEIPWFCTGGSMGGFGALYHGIKYGCNGIYVIHPQVDLRQKVVDYQTKKSFSSYHTLCGDDLQQVPNVTEVVLQQATVPPLFLVQHQYDTVNYFAEHGFKLIEAYNELNGWYSLRIFPSAGHKSDGSFAEAQLFFSRIIDKNLPRQAPSRS